MVLVYGISAGIQTIAGAIAPSMVETSAKLLRVGEPLGLGTVAITSLVNSVFEEVFVCAYVISALQEKRGLAVAVNVSVALRVTYHLYQGALGALTSRAHRAAVRLLVCAQRTAVAGNRGACAARPHWPDAAR